MNGLAEKLAHALAERKKQLARCPFMLPRHRQPDSRGPCPECKATSAGPCWVNVGADAAFVDAVRELIPHDRGDAK